MLLTHKRKILCLVIIAGLAKDTLACGQPSGTEHVETVNSNQLWKSSLEIGHGRSWSARATHMRIQPTTVDGRLYIPNNLPEAWRELDRMLPRSFVRVVAARSRKEECLSGAGRSIYVLHDALVGFVFDAWLSSGQTPYSKYLDQSFNLTPLREDSDVEYALAVRSSAAAWTLCSYYNWKYSKKGASLVRIEGQLREEITRLKDQAVIGQRSREAH